MAGASAAARVGTLLGGRFRLERLVDAGGTTTLYEAVGPDGERCSVRVLDDGLASSREQADRFMDEAKRATAIRSEHVVRVHEVAIDEATGAPFAASELLDGFDVGSLMARVGPIEPTVAARIVVQAALGLTAAHAEGVSRAVRPSDLWLHGAGASSAEAPRTIVVKVTALVASDAQELTGEDAVPSLGLTLWSMLAGRAPGDSDDPSTLTTDPAPRLQDVAPWIDPSLARLVHGMLRAEGATAGAPESGRRTRPSLQEVVDALSRFVGGRASLLESDLVAMSPSQRARRAPSQTRPLEVTLAEESRPHRSQRGAAAPPIEQDYVHASAARAPSPSISSAPPDSGEPSSLVGQTLGERYHLEGLLGRGGMGAVYEATGPDGARVAMKVVLGDTRKPESLRRFVREARTTTAIESPHVVRVLDVDGDTDRNLPFIVMELLHGKDLERTLQEHGALEPEVVARLFMQACQGLAAAHARGVVHRDIKPANIFLHEELDGRITAKICDFGIAKQLQVERDAEAAPEVTNLTFTGSMIGSPAYMSPEQAKSSKDIDARSDVWSLGAALFEALSGRRLWEGRSLGELMAAILGEPVPRVDTIAPWIAPALADVVACALEKDRDRRFPTMEAFAAALEPHAVDVDVLGRASLRAVESERRALSVRAAAASRTRESGASHASSGAVPPSKRSLRPAWVASAIGIAVAATIAVSLANR